MRAHLTKILPLPIPARHRISLLLLLNWFGVSVTASLCIARALRKGKRYYFAINNVSGPRIP